MQAYRSKGAACRWDPSSGNLRSDTSALAVVLCDEMGTKYWHRADALTGEVAVFDGDGKTIIGGQVHQIVKVVKSLPGCTVTVSTVVLSSAIFIGIGSLRMGDLPSCGVSGRSFTVTVPPVYWPR